VNYLERVKQCVMLSPPKVVRRTPSTAKFMRVCCTRYSLCRRTLCSVGNTVVQTICLRLKRNSTLLLENGKILISSRTLPLTSAYNVDIVRHRHAFPSVIVLRRVPSHHSRTVIEYCVMIKSSSGGISQLCSFRLECHFEEETLTFSVSLQKHVRTAEEKKYGRGWARGRVAVKR
jgi:hypothetical protein